MDNEKEKYEYALERGEECLKTLEDSTIKSLKFTVEDVRDTILCILPELKESEDDRIRKATIKCLKWLRDEARWTDIYGISFNSIFAWLEKQGEQKSVDKVEPKFKVGDWVIFNENNNSAYQVERIDDYRYYLRHYLGGTLLVPFNNELIRLWTIQDAKAGDVLFSCGLIFIYAGVNPKGLLLYSYIESDRGIPIFEYNIGKPNVGIGSITDTNIHPATKEQRNLLFAKMKEAGYEWDAEKKELKKIEKNSIEPDDLIKESYQQQADDLIDMVTEKPVWSKVDFEEER